MELINQIPPEIDILAERVAEQLKQKNLLAAGHGVADRVAQILKNDRLIKKILGTQ
jgi:hypothetical protein